MSVSVCVSEVVTDKAIVHIQVRKGDEKGIIKSEELQRLLDVCLKYRIPRSWELLTLTHCLMWMCWKDNKVYSDMKEVYRE